jgi:hypothetical protein
MKYILKLFVALFMVAALFSACDKVDDLPVYSDGSAPVLSSSKSTVAVIPADSSNTAISFSWTNPQFAQDTAKYKYVLQVDSAGRNFSKAASKVVTGSLGTSLTGKELNNMLLAFGFEFNKAYDVDVRVIASYGNNNQQLTSNTIKLKATPYKVPPKVALPGTQHLYITGGATDFDWSNPSVMPAIRELTRLDETTWGGIFHLSGGSNYLLLQQGGNWDDKYSVDNATNPTAEAGSFNFKTPNDFPANVAGGAGWYKMIYDFQQGKYTATKVNNALSTDLYITGGATPGGWVNNPPAAQKFTQVTNGVFELTIALAPGGEYKFLNTSGQWQPQFGGSSATGGTFGSNYGGGNDPANIPTPAVAGNYKITVNFIAGTYSVVKV